VLSVLICAAAGPVADDLHASPVWRDDVERHKADSLHAGLSLAVAAQPNLVVIDRDLPRAEKLVQEIRANAQTAGCSIVVVATGDSQPLEVELLEAGANAILRHPPDAGWEERLGRLLRVPTRRNLRLHVDLEVQGYFGAEQHTGRALNVSRTGMLLECPAAARVGDELAFSLHLSMDMSVKGSARVVRMAGANRYGCEFLAMEAWDARRFEHFLETTPAPAQT
jgi:CheY-like chemotaxis protein